MATDGTCLIPAGPLTLATSVHLREEEMKDKRKVGEREWWRQRGDWLRLKENLMKSRETKSVRMKDETQDGEREIIERKLARLQREYESML